MDAQAIGIGELGVSRSSRPFTVRWRWCLLLFVSVMAAVVFNAANLADEVRLERLANFTPLPGCRSCRPVGLEPSELIRAAMFAIALATIAAIPAITVICLLGRRVGVRPSAIAAAALLGGLLMFTVATRLVSWTLSSLGDELGAVMATVVVVPMIEEATKAAAVLVMGLAMGWRLGVRPGIVLGAATGLVVTILEIALYVQLNYAGGSNTAYGTIIAIRLGLFGLGVHVVASAVAGAGVGAWLAQAPPRRPRVLIGCLAAAVAIHGVWNLVGSSLISAVLMRIYPNPDFESLEPIPMAPLFIASSLTQLVLLVIPFAALVVAWRRDARVASSLTTGALGAA